MKFTQRDAMALISVFVTAVTLFTTSALAEGPLGSDRHVDATQNSQLSGDVVNATARPPESKLSEIERALVGTWERSSFLNQTKVSFTAERSYQYDFSIPGQKEQAGEWKVENGTELVYLKRNADGTSEETMRSRIVVVNEQELRLQTLSPASQDKVYTFTRVEETATTPAKPDPVLIPLGKVVELTVNDDSKDLCDCCIDFETGRLFSIPKKYRTGQASPPPVIKEWIVPNGIDAIGETKQALKGLFGFHMVAIPIDGSADSLPEITAASLSSQFVDTVPGLPVPISGRGELPATYLFQTREGSRGVLQIIGFSEEARGVTIRYKLLSGDIANRDSEQL